MASLEWETIGHPVWKNAKNIQEISKLSMLLRRSLGLKNVEGLVNRGDGQSLVHGVRVGDGHPWESKSPLGDRTKWSSRACAIESVRL